MNTCMDVTKTTSVVMAKPHGRSNLGIYAYGSLLTDPGNKIAPHIIDRISCPSPWPIEYARRGKVRGYGPTLVIHRAGGTVQGKILVLDVQVNGINEAREWLREREGNPPGQRVKEMEWDGFGRVLYCDLEATIGDADLNPESLAKFAVDSVHEKPDRNGIRYLANNIEQGVITPLTYAYRDAILRVARASDLWEAEKNILARKWKG